eukprot:403373945
MSENLKCIKCKKIFNTGRRLPIELPCSTKICINRNACLKCVNKHILPSKAEDGSYTCCNSDQHTIASNFIFERDESIFNKVKNRKNLTIKCMEHEDVYVEHYCHSCKKLICIRCYNNHAKHIEEQGGDSSFTPEKFSSYLNFVIPQLNEITEEIKQSVKIFKKALPCDKEFEEHEISSEISILQEEELKQDQVDINALVLRIRCLESEQLKNQDKFVKLNHIEKQLNDKLTKERQQQEEKFKTLKQSLDNKVNGSHEYILRTTDQKIQQGKQSMLNQFQNSKQQQDKLIKEQIELELNTLNQTFEQFKGQQNLRLQAQDTALSTNNQKLTNFETILKQNINKLSKKCVELQSSIGKDMETSCDRLQLKVKEYYRLYANSNSIALKNLQLLNGKAIQQIMGPSNINLLFTDQQLGTYSKAIQESIEFQFRKLVDWEIQKTQNSILSMEIQDYEAKQYSLLYKGSRDGFNYERLHQLCDNEGPTVTFIQSELGLVFGGYTSIPLTKPNITTQIRDEDAFIFSLSKRSTHRQIQNSQYGVQHHKNFLFAFGGSDICIHDNCNKNMYSKSNLGHTYSPPSDFKYDSNEAKSYLAGNERFQVLEIEVYSFQ